jgi:hypothetical protein
MPVRAAQNGARSRKAASAILARRSGRDAAPIACLVSRLVVQRNDLMVGSISARLFILGIVTRSQKLVGKILALGGQNGVKLMGRELTHINAPNLRKVPTPIHAQK